MKILIVDDEKNIRTSLSRFFDLHGNTVSSAESGSDALDQLRKQAFDCMLLDLKLPDLDGIQVLEKVREIDPYLPVILLTAHGSTASQIYIWHGVTPLSAVDLEKEAMAEIKRRKAGKQLPLLCESGHCWT